MKKNQKLMKKLIKAINKSPLGFIKGDCRLVSNCPSEFPTISGNGMNDDDDSFFENPKAIITFGHQEKFLGEIKLNKEIITRSDFSDEKSSNLDLDLRDKKNILYIFIKCPEGAGFPYLEEFGEFIATLK
jgi:hypothetical protein